MHGVHLFIIIFLFPSLLLAQKVSKVVNADTGESYYVLRTDNKTKHGEYIKRGIQNNILVKRNF